MPISDIDAGRIMEKMDSMHGDVKNIWDRVESLGKFEVLTQERLSRGAQHFNNLDDRIEKVEGRSCPSFPKPGVVYAMITLGVAVLGVLVMLR